MCRVSDKGSYFTKSIGVKTCPVSTYSIDVSGDVRVLTGGIGIGTNAGPYSLMIDGDVSITGSYRKGNNAIVSSQWTTSGTTIEYNTGSVGIGTSALGNKLNVGGTLKTTGLITSTGLTSSGLITENGGVITTSNNYY
jgi:hypothetical protein